MYLKQAGIYNKIDEIAVSKELSPADRSRKIQKLIRHSRLTAQDELGQCIMKAFKDYKTSTKKIWYAVRSSAVQEDTHGLAYAGMGKTDLFVNEETLFDKIVNVEASVWTERAIIYYEENGVNPLDVRQAVVIQEMVDSEISGVIFTQNPVTDNNSQVVINASYGLGEAIVSGIVSGDQYITDKASGEEISELFIGTKRIKIVKNPKGPGTKTEYVELKLRNSRALTVEQTKALTIIARYLEEFFGYPVDIEFGIQHNTIWVIQVRPVTTDIEA
jgi:pyruvate,water dikinase